MKLSFDGLIGTALGLLALAGVGLPLVVPNTKFVGWTFIVLAGVGSFVLVRFQFFPKRATGSQSDRSVKMIALYGMILSGLTFACCAAIYFWPANERVNSTPSVQLQVPHLEPDKQVTQPVLDPEDPAETGKAFANRPIDYFANQLKTQNALIASRTIEPYLGMLVSFTAFVQANNINGPASGPFSVGMNLEDGTLLICQFSSRFKDYLARLDNRQRVEITGTLERASGLNLVLSACHPVVGDSKRPNVDALANAPNAPILPPSAIVSGQAGSVIGTFQKPATGTIDATRYPKRICFDYSQNNGSINVSLNGISFEVDFGKADNTRIYIYNNGHNTKSIGVAKHAKPGDALDFGSVDKTSTHYDVPIGGYFFVQNVDSYVLIGRVLSLKDDSRGDDADEVCFTYDVDMTKSGRFHAI